MKSNAVVWRFLKFSFSTVFFMGISRFLLLIKEWGHFQDKDLSQIGLFIMTSLRFDFMILGFLILYLTFIEFIYLIRDYQIIKIPISCLEIIRSYKVLRLVLNLIKGVFLNIDFMLAISVSIIVFGDLIFFVFSQNHFDHEYKFDLSLSNLMWGTGFSIVYLMTSGWLLKHYSNSIQKQGLPKLAIRQVLFFMITSIIFARSSFGPHHLDLRFSEISKDAIFNELVLNGPYSLDQYLRNRK